ncbi:MAG: hypothetical protein GF331_04325, partial [Chitinivibrionales bacterium]|nr:hypothetical protein [Chitinivibrionales bacterium]
MHLVPFPQRLKRSPGAFGLERRTAQARIGGPRPVSIRHKLSELDIKAKWHHSDNSPSIVIGKPPERMPRPPRKPEGYRLIVSRKGIALTAHDLDGLFWGLTTLQQLIDDKRRVACVDITDWPAFGLRYHHDDISRKQVSKLADFKRIIRLLSYYKIKYYTPYMEDMLYLESFPDIGEGRGRLTPSEVKAIHAEARKYNVTVFPTYSLIGHQ